MILKGTAAAVVGVLAVIAICVAGWFGYWTLASHSQSRRYDVNTHSQQYQASLVAQERDRVAGYDAATNDAQKRQIATTFCAVYTQLTDPPSDLTSAQSRICN